MGIINFQVQSLLNRSDWPTLIGETKILFSILTTLFALGLLKRPSSQLCVTSHILTVPGFFSLMNPTLLYLSSLRQLKLQNPCNSIAIQIQSQFRIRTETRLTASPAGSEQNGHHLLRQLQMLRKSELTKLSSASKQESSRIFDHRTSTKYSTTE